MSREIKILREGEVVGRSKNLRGLRVYARDHRTEVIEWDVSELDKGRGLLFVRWKDGATCSAFFESYSVAIQFAHNRRSWPH